MTEFTPAPGDSGDGDEQVKADCAEVIAEVWTLLDGECTSDTRQKLRQHLEECPGCLRHYGVEERVKALIATKCKGEKAPQRLRERLQVEISRTTIIRF